MSETKYVFTSDQLLHLLVGTIELYCEYRHTHGYDTNRAETAAVVDTLEGLEAERELIDQGEILPANATQSWPLAREGVRPSEMADAW